MVNADLNEKLQRQTAELDGIKTAAAVAESVKLDEIDSERRRCAEEVATLQQLMKGEFCYCAALLCASFSAVNCKLTLVANIPGRSTLCAS